MDDERQAAVSVQVDYVANRLEVKVNMAFFVFFFQKVAFLKTLVLRFDNIWPKSPRFCSRFDSIGCAIRLSCWFKASYLICLKHHR